MVRMHRENAFSSGEESVSRIEALTAKPSTGVHVRAQTEEPLGSTFNERTTLAPPRHGTH